MDKEQFMSYVQDIKTGERTRILLDLIMEELKLGPEAKFQDFTQKIKQTLEKEQEAVMALQPDKYKQKNRHKEKPVSVSN